MIKTYKIRLYPTQEQEQLMWKHIGACRYIWNWMITKQKTVYEAGGKYLSAFDMMKLLSPLKNDGEHGWMREISNVTCKIICRDVDKAFQGFFNKQLGYPKFKSRKHSKNAFPVRGETMQFVGTSYVKVEKLHRIKCRIDKRLDVSTKYKFLNAHITYMNYKWILTVGIESENQAPDLTDKSMGIDLGVKDSAVVAYGDEKLVFSNINKSRQIRLLKQKVDNLQRMISRKYEANKIDNKFIKTKNIERCEERLRRLYARLTNIRMNYIHQSTHKLVSLLPYRVVMEDLNVSGIIKNRHLSQSLQEQCLYEWIRQMKYKCEWNGIEFVQVDRFYPSSKTCSNCGCIKHNLKLSDRTFICNECGFEIDRDFNAALNLSRYAA